MTRHRVRTAWFPFLLVITSSGLGFARLGPEQGKPTNLILANTEFKEPPSSLRDMLSAAEAVVFGRILGGVSKDGDFYHKDRPGITTLYRFRIGEILRAPAGRAIDQSEISVLGDGGLIDRGHKIDKLEIDGFPQFELGHQYVLFLRWHNEHAAWTPAWGPHGIFEVKAGAIHSLGSAPIARAQDGLAIANFLAKLRR